MKPEYLRLNEVAELLKCEPHHVKDLMITDKLRCGVMARGWRVLAFPPHITPIALYSEGDEHHVELAETAESWGGRTFYAFRFWYLNQTEIIVFVSAGDEVIDEFRIEPVDGDSMYIRRRECRGEIFYVLRALNELTHTRLTWQDILFLRRDVEELLEVDAREPAPLITAAADRTRVNSAADFNEAVYQSIVALGLNPLALPAPRPGRKGGWQAEVRRHLQAEAKKPERAWLNPSADRMRHARAALLKDRRIAELPTAD